MDMKAEDLQKTVDALEGDGFLSIKYADKDEYCLGLTKEGRSLVLEVRAERERRKAAAEEAARADAERKEAERKAEEERLERDRREREAREAAARERKKREEEKAIAREEIEEDDIEPALDYPLTVGADEIKGQAPVAQKEGNVPQESAPKAPISETRIVLYVWLAAFLGALLGGGIVGLVMYVLHVVLK